MQIKCSNTTKVHVATYAGVQALTLCGHWTGNYRETADSVNCKVCLSLRRWSSTPPVGLSIKETPQESATEGT